MAEQASNDLETLMKMWETPLKQRIFPQRGESKAREGKAEQGKDPYYMADSG